MEVTETKTVRPDLLLNDTAAAIIKRRLIGQASRYVFCNHLGKRIPQLTNAVWTAVAEAGLLHIEVDKNEKEKIFWIWLNPSMKTTHGANPQRKNHQTGASKKAAALMPQPYG